MLERIQIADVAQVYKLCNEVAAAANDGDVERWISLWIDDGLLMPPFAPCCAGKPEIRREMQRLFDRFDARSAVIQPEEVRILGNWAYAHGTYRFEAVPRERGEGRSCVGRFLAILQKQADGSWKIAVDCHNYDASSSPGSLPRGVLGTTRFSDIPSSLIEQKEGASK